MAVKEVKICLLGVSIIFAWNWQFHHHHHVVPLALHWHFRGVDLTVNTAYTHKLEMVHCSVARPGMSATAATIPAASPEHLLSQLEWVPLATRRANTCLCMMYRVAHTGYAGRRPLDSLADIRGAHHSGVPCVEIYSNINITRRLQIIFLTTRNNSLEPSAFNYHRCLQVLTHSVRDSSLVSHNPSTQLSLVQCTHKSHSSLLYTPLLHS